MAKGKATLERPRPPPELFDRLLPWSVPAPEVVNWIAEAILSDAGPLHNPDHQHLAQATIGCLWTTAERARNGQRVIGMAERPMFRCHAWAKARQEQQLVEWFGVVPDFVITLDAHYCTDASDVEFAALIEHELYHCAQATDEFGEPKFTRDTGEPVWAMRGHDVEEFIGVVRRYGTGPKGGALEQLIEAGTQAPEVSNLNIARACGTCLHRVA